MRSLARWLIPAWLLGLSAMPAVAAPPIEPIPADNSDLAALQARAEALTAQGLDCGSTLECPKLDCASAQALLQAVVDAETHLRAMHSFLEKANADHMAHFRSLADEGRISNDNLGRAIWALGLQHFLHNMGSMLLDLASVSGAVQEVLEDPSKLKPENVGQFLENLDKLYETLKDAESFVTTEANSLLGNAGKVEGVVNPALPALTGAPDAINNYKSDVSDAIGTFKEVVEQAGGVGNLKDARKAADALKEAFKKPNGPAAALGQVVGRHLKAWSEDVMKEREQQIAALTGNLAATDLAQAGSYQALQRVQNRRFAAEDALKALNEARAALEACIAKHCGPSSYTRPVIPNFYETAPDGREVVSWGKALNYLNAKLPELTAALAGNLVFTDDCPKAPGIGFIPDWTLYGDAPAWCNFGGFDEPLFPGGPGGTFFPTPPLPGGDDPRDAPPDGPGDDPRDAPPPTAGDDPRDAPTDGDDPRDAPPPDGDDPRDVPTVTIFVKAKLANGVTGQDVAGTTLKLDLGGTPALPGTPGAVPDIATGAGADPLTATLDGQGEAQIKIEARLVETGTGTLRDLGIQTGGTLQLNVDAAPKDGVIISGEKPITLPATLGMYPSFGWTVGGTYFTSLLYPDHAKDEVKQALTPLTGQGFFIETDYCRTKQAPPADPYFSSRGTWGQDYADQWALERIGLTAGPDSAWERLGPSPKPVIVAVVDTGLDWNHQDLPWSQLWRNPGEVPGNGRDDDGNGYVDDAIGWNFWDANAKPWDLDGHGTFVAGLIAAAHNGTGIAGVNPHARIMVLKALNAFGNTRASYLARAIVYAADHGARVINVSVGGKNVTRAEEAAVAYARGKGALVVIAAGNEGVETATFGPAGNAQALIVAATDVQDRRAGFSNWGPGVDLAAPGVDILSLRARRTDLMRDIPGIKYTPGAAYVGEDRRYYRTSGTSFAAPLVSGLAALLLSRDPTLTPDDLERILKNSARDIETPGVDQYTGYGLLDARAALAAVPKFEINAAITGLAVTRQDGAQAVQVTGTATADQFAGAVVEIGAGEAPQSWAAVGKIAAPVAGGVLTSIPAQSFAGSTRWTVRVVVRHANGRTREARYALNLG
jgi:subtilisin family serine protease